MASRDYSGPVWLDISQIDSELRPASLMRASIVDEAIEEYAENLADMPPIRVTADENDVHWLDDGSYRVRASLKAGKTQVACLVRPGTYLDAFEAACRANSTHGVRITNADKRRRVEAAISIPEHASKSNREIAKICGVSSTTVDRIRPDVQQSGTSPKRDSLGRTIPSKKKLKTKQPETRPGALDPSSAQIEADPEQDSPSDQDEGSPADGLSDEGEVDAAPSVETVPVAVGETDPDVDDDESDTEDDDPPCLWEIKARNLEKLACDDFHSLPANERFLFAGKVQSIGLYLVSRCPNVVDRKHESLA